MRKNIKASLKYSYEPLYIENKVALQAIPLVSNCLSKHKATAPAGFNFLFRGVNSLAGMDLICEEIWMHPSNFMTLKKDIATTHLPISSSANTNSLRLWGSEVYSTKNIPKDVVVFINKEPNYIHILKEKDRPVLSSLLFPQYVAILEVD